MSQNSGFLKNFVSLPKVLIICLVISFITCQQLMNQDLNENAQENNQPFEQAENNISALTWNYTNNGTDWKSEGECGKMFVAQSPFDVTRKNNTEDFHSPLVLPWQDYQFAFVTKYNPLPAQAGKVVDYVYTINVTNTLIDTVGFNGFWGSEPFHFIPQPQNHIVRWDIDYIQFHYASEHRFNGSQADLEMQIYHKDTLGNSLACSASKQAVISVFFNKNGTESPGTFFEQLFPTDQTKSSVADLSQLLDMGSSMKAFITGYVGSGTQPPCTKNVCWYIYEKFFNIPEHMYFKFLVSGVEHNFRKDMQSPWFKYKYTFTHNGVFAKENPNFGNDEL